jgi:hypothetical protein
MRGCFIDTLQPLSSPQCPGWTARAAAAPPTARSPPDLSDRLLAPITGRVNTFAGVCYGMRVLTRRGQGERARVRSEAQAARLENASCMAVAPLLGSDLACINPTAVGRLAARELAHYCSCRVQSIVIGHLKRLPPRARSAPRMAQDERSGAHS